MPTLDRFESIFRSSIKEVYQHTPLSITRAALVTDMDVEESSVYLGHIKNAFEALTSIEWTIVHRGEYSNVEELIQKLDAIQPDLLCTYRNLYTRDKKWPYSLGTYLDVMAQITPFPVLVLPHPTPAGDPEARLRRVAEVLVVTDHLAGSATLIDHAVHFTPRTGKLILGHVEDSVVFDRYMTLIGKLPEINTEYARSAIRQRLLSEPHDYIDSCRRVLVDAGLLDEANVVEEIHMGDHVADYRAIIDAHHIDLVVFTVRDDDQLAMHGLAYPLAIELRDVPVLMI